jgi:ABC-type multidrug transport system fused ATPase/permease subunit
MLELKDATLSLGGRQLLKGLSVMAMKGQMTCVTGSPGCGKSALLRVLMGFIPLDSGMVSVDGELISELSADAFRRMMAYVPQETVAQPSPFVPDTDDLETAWSGERLPRHILRALTPPMVEIHDKPIVLLDEPPVAMVRQVRVLADEGRTVVVATQRTEFLDVADKIIKLE